MTQSASGSFEGLIETDEGPTFVHTLGKGPPVVVVHGGPGFSHDYLVPVLKPLSRCRRLVFFDQLGCGQTPPPDRPLSLESCFGQLRSILRQFADRGSVGVIAHSWGSLIVAGAMTTGEPVAGGDPEIGEGVLINPMPISSEPYEAARKRLIALIPLSVRLKAPLRALLSGDGAAVMRLLLPYYMYDPANIPTGDFALNLKTYRTLDGQLKGFDLGAALPHLRQLSIIRGSHEFASREDIDELVSATRGLQTIEHAGHFPFWEAPDEFTKLLTTYFS